MHMADALISPEVGAAMWAVSAGVALFSVRKINASGRSASTVPYMGILGAFIFAAQMINFGIPGTGSSGHLGGGLLLAILLGPWAGFLTIGSVLAIQALFFADGGILAFGCNLFNLGFIPCFLAYPLVYQAIDPPGGSHSKARVWTGSLAAAVIGLQLGAFCVVLQTLCSGISSLPFAEFTLLMQPIHLAIGLVEGVATAAVVLLIRKLQPGLAAEYDQGPMRAPGYLKRTLLAVVLMTVIVGGAVSWFASTRPDGLEWAIEGTAAEQELPAPETGIYATFAHMQETLAILPDYGFRNAGEQGDAEEAWPQVSGGTTVSGLFGAALLIVSALLLGWIFRRKTSGMASDHR